MNSSTNIRRLGWLLCFLMTNNQSLQTAVGVGKIPVCARPCLEEALGRSKCTSGSRFECLCADQDLQSSACACFDQNCDYGALTQAFQFLSACASINQASPNGVPGKGACQKSKGEVEPSQTSNSENATQLPEPFTTDNVIFVEVLPALPLQGSKTPPSDDFGTANESMSLEHHEKPSSETNSSTPVALTPINNSSAKVNSTDSSSSEAPVKNHTTSHHHRNSTSANGTVSSGADASSFSRATFTLEILSFFWILLC